MAEPPRVTPKEVQARLKAGSALLVCGYEDDAKFREFRLEGAISFREFSAMLPKLPKTQEIIFYCA